MTEPSPAPPGPDTSPRSLLDVAARIGALVWVEQRAFEVIGGWSRTTAGDAEAQVLFATQARHHAWRAEQLAARFPRVADVHLADRVGPPDAGTAALLDRLEAIEPDEAVARLVASYRVLLPQIVAEHELDLARATPVADGAFRRTLRQVLADEQDDLAAGEAVLDARLAADPAAPSAAGALVASLTADLDGATPA